MKSFILKFLLTLFIFACIGSVEQGNTKQFSADRPPGQVVQIAYNHIEMPLAIHQESDIFNSPMNLVIWLAVTHTPPVYKFQEVECEAGTRILSAQFYTNLLSPKSGHKTEPICTARSGSISWRTSA